MLYYTTLYYTMLCRMHSILHRLIQTMSCHVISHHVVGLGHGREALPAPRPRRPAPLRAGRPSISISNVISCINIRTNSIVIIVIIISTIINIYSSGRRTARSHRSARPALTAPRAALACLATTTTLIVLMLMIMSAVDSDDIAVINAKC